MSGKDVFAFGVAALIIGAIAVLIYNPSGTAPYAAGLVLVAGGMARIYFRARSLAANDVRRGPAPDEDQLVGRHGPSEEGPQLAGSKCVHCAQKILSTLEASACRVCAAPLHRECRKEHRRDAHRETSGQAYR